MTTALRVFVAGCVIALVFCAAFATNPDGSLSVLQLIYCPDGWVFPECRGPASSILLFDERYSVDASGLIPVPFFFDSTKVTLVIDGANSFFLSGSPDILTSWICDDEVYVVADDVTFGTHHGPYGLQPGVPPYPRCAPIESILVPNDDLEITQLLTDILGSGTHCVEFRLGDTQREVYGNTKIYLITMVDAVPAKESSWGEIKARFQP